MTATAAPMPPWLHRHLVAQGVMTEDRVTIRAKPRRCRRCKALILVALDGPMCAFSVQLDPSPTTTAGEAFVLLTGRRTYDLDPVTREIHYRDALHIEKHSADEKGTIHATHECQSPRTPAHPNARTAEQMPTWPPVGKPPF